MKTIRNAALAAATLMAASALVSACSKSKGGDATDPRCNDGVVSYEGYATDEACKAMLDAEDAGQITIGGANAPAVGVIGSNGKIAASASALTLTWTSPLDLDGDTFLFQRRAPQHRKLASASHDLGRELLRLVSPESTAWAHLPPMTGALHMLRIKGIGGSTTFLAFTTKLHFAVTSSALTPILATASPMQVELTDAYLTENRIVTPSTDGPFRPAADTTFQVQ